MQSGGKRERSQWSQSQRMKAVYLTIIVEFTALLFNDRNQTRKNSVEATLQTEHQGGKWAKLKRQLTFKGLFPKVGDFLGMSSPFTGHDPHSHQDLEGGGTEHVAQPQEIFQMGLTSVSEIEKSWDCDRPWKLLVQDERPVEIWKNKCVGLLFFFFSKQKRQPIWRVCFPDFIWERPCQSHSWIKGEGG